MSSKDEHSKEPEIPDVIKDTTNGTIYIKGRFFGKGGFAKCYEIADKTTGKTYAGKIVSKKLLVKNNQKEKMLQEIEIHRSLNHKHVVDFRGFFDDKNFVYIILELCKRRSMMELHKRRKALTEPEVRYYMHQILLGVQYLHQTGIIHRDLKLGNLLLSEDVEVKIADFGLATKVEFSGQRKKTMCGTPNYIAPEILTKSGHSFEVDIWSVGCIMYTLLVGKPPFETNSLKETYERIKRCEYKIPIQLKRSFHAVDMINRMLQTNPHKRPSVNELLTHPFINSGYMPTSLPVSCLTMAPRFDVLTKEEMSTRKPLGELNCEKSPLKKEIMTVKPSVAGTTRSPKGVINNIPDQPQQNENAERIAHMQTVLQQLKNLMKSNINILPPTHSALEETTDPSAQPFFWVSKWVDYSDKYGFGYQLCDDSVGVMFNDQTKIVLLSNQRNVHYFERDGIESYYVVDQTPPQLDKKMRLLMYFLRYMSEHLMKTGGSVQTRESDKLSRLPYVNYWHRSGQAVIMQLANGTIQMNHHDHSKVIICPLMEAITYIDREKNFRTYRMETIAANGCTSGLHDCLVYLTRKLSILVQYCAKQAMEG